MPEIDPNVKITLFNSNARVFKAKMPVLRMNDEFEYYGVEKKYASTKCYENEYLFPFAAGPDEIVCTWTWSEIKDQMKTHGWSARKWYEEVTVNKYEEHEKARKEGKTVVCDKQCSCCGH